VRSRSSWLDWLLPPRCGSCRSLGAWLCDGCLARVRRLREPLCPRCGRELEFAGSGCGCRRRLRWLARSTSAAAYEGPLETALHRFKYEGWRALAPALADLVEDRLRDEASAGQRPLVLSVPLHPRRLRARGYNQSELLAAELRRRVRLDPPAGRLVRVRDTPPQVGLDRPRRRANVAGAFGWRGPSPAGRACVVIDDVATTGATLEACAAALRSAGSGPVVGLTVARVSV